MTTNSPPAGGSAGFRAGAEEVLHEGRIVRLVSGAFTGPDGSQFQREIVHHPGAVAVVPLHADGTITLVRQYRAALDDLVLEIPAGLRDVDGEPPVVTAARELAEEVGLVAGSLTPLCVFHNSPGFTDEEVHVFVGTDLHEVGSDLQGIEEQHLTVEVIHRDAAIDLIRSGVITDAKTVIALSLLAAEAAPPGPPGPPGPSGARSR